MTDVHHAGASRGPLDGLRVIDLTTTMMGPWCTMHLARLGADVVKVESPAGDITREIGPARTPGMGTGFFNPNAGKRSIVIDLKTRRGPATLLALIEQADVFVTNVRPTALARAGITPEIVGSRAPSTIFCQLAGFGGEGPYGCSAAYDDMIQAISGIASVQGGSSAPAYIKSSAADKITALEGVIAILAAVIARRDGAQGQRVEVAMFEALAAFILAEHQQGAIYEPQDGDVGYPRVISAERRPFRTKDGVIGLTPYTDQQWRALFAEIGRGDLIDDPRTTGIKQRTENTDFLYGLLAEALLARPSADWLEAFRAAEIPAAPVLSLEDLFEDEHLRAVELFEHTVHPSEGAVKQARLPMRFSGTPMPTARHVPRLGEHTAEVLREYGFDASSIERLTSSGAVRERTGLAA